MSFIGYLDKMRLGGGNKQKDTNPPRRRGIQPNSGARPSSSSAAIINSAPSSMIALVESDSGNEPTDEDEDYNDLEQVNEEEPVENDDSGSNPENPYEFAPSDPLNEEKLMAEEHWSRGQLDLWHKIKGRGSYPIFPPNWMLDFSNLPDELFVDPSLDPIIGAMNKKLEVRAILAFDNLMQLGGRVRDKMESGQNVEKWLGKELEKYVAWAMKDGDIPSTYTGVFSVAASPQFEVCERRMSKRMAELSERHRTALETSRQFYASRRSSLLSSHASNSSTNKNLRLLPSPLPPDGEPPAANLYGFAIVESRVALVALNTAKIEAPMRTLLVVNYSDPGMDVWNAIAIALMVCQARDEQMARVEWAKKIAAETGFEGWGGFGEEDL